MSYETFVQEVKKQCEALRSEASKLYVDPPQVDLSTEVDEFCDSLKYLDDDERERKLKDFIRPSVEHEVEKWQSQFSHAQSSLVRLHDLIDDVDREKRNLEVEVSTINQEKSDLKTKRASSERKLDKISADAVGVKPITPYSKMSYQMFIIGTLIIGILTAWYYLTIQTRIQFAQDINPERGSDFFPGTLAYLQQKPENIIYGLGVVMFLLAGKVISVIYEKLDHNRIFFLVCAVICLGAIGGSVYLVGDVSAKTGTISDLRQSAPPADVLGLCSPESQDEACLARSRWEADLAAAQASIGNVRFFMTIVVLSAEILLGAIAWMLASEYHEKRMGESNNLARRKELVENDVKKTSDELAGMDEKLASLNSQKSELETVASQLLSLRNSLPTREYITKQKQILIDQQIQRGMSKLLQKKHAWELDARSNS